MRRQNAASLKFLIIAAVLLTISAPASATFWDKLSDFDKPNLKWGKFELHPYYKITETYDSNIYLVPNSLPNGLRVGCLGGATGSLSCSGGVVGSWITENNVGLKALLTLSERHKFGFGYDLDYAVYSRQPTANNAVHQAVNADYGYKGPTGLSAKLGDAFLSTTDPAFSELITRQHRWSNTVSAAGEYAPEGGALYVEIDASHTNDKYVNPNLSGQLNRYDQVSGLRVGYQVQPKTRVYVAYHREIIHYTDRRDANSKSHLGAVGISGDITPKLKGQIEAGGVYRQYDALGAGGAPKIARDATVSARLTYKPGDRTAAALALSRGYSESTFGNNRYYVSSIASLGVTHKFPYKLTASLNLSGERDQYPVAAAPSVALGAPSFNRRDDLYQGQAGLDYDIREWLKVGASHMYRTRWAKNFTHEFNYNDHRSEVHLAVTF